MVDYVSDETWEVLRHSLDHVVDVINAVPGATVVVRYVQSSYQHDPWRLFLEVVLVVILLNYVFSRRFRIKDRAIKLTEKEVDELVREWTPEPFAPSLSAEDARLVATVPVAEEPLGIETTVGGRSVLNMASFNFLGLAGVTALKDVARQALDKYGVGSCGPPGFYGTIDVHTQLEKKAAAFLGTEDAILYSFGFATVSSAIPAFCKRGDIIMADYGVNFAIQKGLLVSRAQVKFFKHNDAKDLERLLEEVRQDDLKKKKPLNRRFIVIEGLYLNYGDIAPLKELIQLKNKYKYRLVVEESMSLGVLGKTGRGITEYFGVPASEVEMICAGFGNAFAGAGGVCAGAVPYVDHQRLSGQGYCYSASMPALLAASSIASIEILETHQEMIESLRQNTALMRTELKTLRHLVMVGDAISPMIHLQFVRPLPSRTAEECLLQDIVDEVLKHDVLISRTKYVKEELHMPRPSIRLAISQGHSSEQIHRVATVLQQAVMLVVAKAMSDDESLSTLLMA